MTVSAGTQWTRGVSQTFAPPPKHHTHTHTHTHTAPQPDSPGLPPCRPLAVPGFTVGPIRSGLKRLSSLHVLPDSLCDNLPQYILVAVAIFDHLNFAGAVVGLLRPTASRWRMFEARVLDSPWEYDSDLAAWLSTACS